MLSLKCVLVIFEKAASMANVYTELDAAVARLYADVPKTIVVPNGALVFIVGLAGSGKTTFALKNFPLECIVSGDLLRTEISNNVNNQVVSDEAFAFVGAILKERLSRSRTTVVDAKNLESKFRKSFVEIARESAAPMVAIFLDVPADVCIAQDAGRVRQIGAKAIVPDEIRRELALHALVAEGDIAVYRIDTTTSSSVRVILEDHDTYKNLPYQFDSETVRKLYTGNVEVDVHVREQVVGQYIVVSEGGILVLEHDTPSSSIFLRRNFQPYQVLDVRVVAGRLGTEIADDAVVEFVRRMLSCRTRLNLVTVLSVPKGYKHVATIMDDVLSLQKKREQIIAITHVRESEGIGAQLTSALVRIERRGMEDEPLAIIGDVQGCLTALRSVVRRIHKENERRLRDGKRKRRMIFVGDMADRGTYDPESILYIVDLLRSCEALLVRGNHDDNLTCGLRGGDPGSKETARTIAELTAMTTQGEREEIAAIIESMPHIVAWKHVVVAHATLAYIPWAEEKLSQRELHDITHGIATGRRVGGRREIWNLPLSCAKDPDVLFVSGHTHEVAPVIDNIAVAAVLDVGVEKRGELFWMKWPEMELCKGVEPEIARNYKILRGNKLPLSGKRLRQFVDYVAINGYVNIKKGMGEQNGLLIVSYTDITEATNAWSRYPVLRNFRGLVMSETGDIVARPFAKTHKAGVEVPLGELRYPAQRVFEKVNSTLVVLFFWNCEWRYSTKFSFSNEYTKAAKELLAGADFSKLDMRKTYLFEIILPSDPHIVDYQGEMSVILLNVINTMSGKYARWEFVEKSARKFGVRTAKDVTHLWPQGTSVADIYRGAQMPGAFENVEGFMVRYVDGSGCTQTVKIKARCYDDRKFVRDMKWSKLLEAFDFVALDVPLQKRIEILWYNVSNPAVRAMLEERILWIRHTYRRIIQDAEELVAEPLRAAMEYIATDEAREHEAKMREGLRLANTLLIKNLRAKYGEVRSESISPHMGFIRSALSGKGTPTDAIHKYALRQIEGVLERETEKRGTCAFWIIPE